VTGLQSNLKPNLFTFTASREEETGDFPYSILGDFVHINRYQENLLAEGHLMIFIVSKTIRECLLLIPEKAKSPVHSANIIAPLYSRRDCTLELLEKTFASHSDNIEYVASRAAILTFSLSADLAGKCSKAWV
jgi:hypothetical protein